MIFQKKANHEYIASLFKIKNPRTLELIFAFISANQSKVVAYEKINEVARLNHTTLVSLKNDEVDFIVKNKKIKGIEVKYQSNIAKKDFKKILKFMRKYDLDQRLVITKDLFKILMGWRFCLFQYGIFAFELKF